MLPRPRTLPAGFVPPCLPMKAPKPPSGAQWLHEIKHDGFRVIKARDAEPQTISGVVFAGGGLTLGESDGS
jgi:ATP-dependent DNA ligase